MNKFPQNRLKDGPRSPSSDYAENEFQLGDELDFVARGLNREELREHYLRYASPQGLSGAALPPEESTFSFQRGYRESTYFDADNKVSTPQIEVALLPGETCAVLYKMIREIGDNVDVCVEAFHGHIAQSEDSVEFFREGIAVEELLVTLQKYQTALVLDGYVAVNIWKSESQDSISNSDGMDEVVLGREKILSVSSDDRLDHFRKHLDQLGIGEDANIKLVYDEPCYYMTAEHLSKQIEGLIRDIQAESS